MTDLRTANHSRNPASPKDVAELRRFELFNAACADLVLVAADDKKDNLFAVQPETKIALVPGFPTLHSDDRIRKQWTNIFSAPGTSLLDWRIGNNEAKLLVFPGGGEYNSTTSGSAI